MKTTEKPSPYRYMSTQSITMSTNYSVKPVQTPASPKPIIRLLSETILYRGFVEGVHQPTGLINLWIDEVSNVQLKNIKTAFRHYFSAYPVMLREIHTTYDLAMCFADGLGLLQKAAGFPIFETIQIKKNDDGCNEFQLLVPMLEESFLTHLIDFMLKFINSNALSVPVLPDNVLVKHIEGLITKLSDYAPKGSNSLRFLEAAHALGIPWMFVEQNVFQLGYGSSSRWLDSSFTDNTSVIATTLARNKLATSMLLRKAGLPVPEQSLAYNEAQAISIARKIGYPVVVKPLNEDGGRGVFARLQSDEMVKNAYQCVKNYSNPVLVEKHITGKDYRLQVVNGKLIWAIERIPAGIVGDGEQSVASLIQQSNTQRSSLLKPIEITEEVILFLAECGLSLESIPYLNECVALSRIANISAGGTPVGVFDKVHPDNKRLAETAANVLRLDIAGIDLIMPDIQHSYLETTATIIEVNAQPQLGIITAPHIYKEILLQILPEKGHIPIVVVFGKGDKTTFINKLESVLLEQAQCVGVAEVNCARINSELIASTPSLFIAGRSLLLNKTVDALIYHVKSIEELAKEGLPFDAFDYLFFYDAPNLENLNHDSNAITTLVKACKRGVVTTDEITSEHEKLLLALGSYPKVCRNN